MWANNCKQSHGHGRVIVSSLVKITISPYLLHVQVKQKLGKANETKDVTFDEFVNNFNKQQV